MDIGCYCVSAARLLAGEPDAVTAQAVRDVGGPTASTCGVAGDDALPGRVLAHFDCALDLPMRRTGCRRRLGGRCSRSTTPGSAASRASGSARRTGRSRRSRSRPPTPYRAQLEDLAGAIADGRRPLLDRAEVVGQARSLQALLRAMSNDEEDVR